MRIWSKHSLGAKEKEECQSGCDAHVHRFTRRMRTYRRDQPRQRGQQSTCGSASEGHCGIRGGSDNRTLVRQTDPMRMTAILSLFASGTNSSWRRKPRTARNVPVRLVLICAYQGDREANKRWVS